MEQVDQRDGRTKVFKNADGTLTTRTYNQPIHVKRPDATWAELDTTVVKKADGRLEAKSTAVKADLAPKANDAAL